MKRYGQPCPGPTERISKNYPVQARIGISRALINANMPFEYVTASDIRSGLAQRYKVIYLPAQAAINEELFPLLEQYVQEGGRLVLDAPGGWWNEQGKVLNTAKGSAFEKIFGASIADFAYSNNVVFTIGTHRLDGFVLDVTPHTAVVAERFQNGQPAVTVNRLGKGTAVLLCADASFSMKTKGNAFMEKWTIKHAMGGIRSPYSCDKAIVYRLAAPQADHYFFMNDGEPLRVKLTSSRYSYKGFADALTGEKLNPAAIQLEGYSGRWVRALK